MKLFKRVALVLVGLLLLSGFGGTLVYLYSKSDTPPPTFGTATPATMTIVKKTVATGSVLPRKEVEIKPQVSGVVDRLFVEPGRNVRTGDPVARIRIIPNMVTLAAAENRVNRARIGVDNAEQDLARNRRLLEEGILARAEFQRFEIAQRNAKEELTAAVDNLELIKKGTTESAGETTNTLVRATIGGTILEVPLQEGDFVIESNTFNEGTTIATIADMDELIFIGRIDESEVGKLRPGMELVLTVGALDEHRLGAKLEHIAPKGVAQNGAIQFEIRAALDPHPDLLLRANYSANADIVLDRRENVLAIDEGLLQFEGDKTFVEIETAPQVFERREIKTGLSDGIHIEVVSGLTERERIKQPGTAVPPRVGA